MRPHPAQHPYIILPMGRPPPGQPGAQYGPPHGMPPHEYLPPGVQQRTSIPSARMPATDSGEQGPRQPGLQQVRKSSGGKLDEETAEGGESSHGSTKRLSSESAELRAGAAGYAPSATASEPPPYQQHTYSGGAPGQYASQGHQAVHYLHPSQQPPYPPPGAYGHPQQQHQYSAAPPDYSFYYSDRQRYMPPQYQRPDPPQASSDIQQLWPSRHDDRSHAPAGTTATTTTTTCPADHPQLQYPPGGDDKSAEDSSIWRAF